MINNLKYILIALFLTTSFGCSYQSYKFANREPLTISCDTLSISVPKSSEYEEGYYYFNSLVKRPLVQSLNFERTNRSGDINSFDEIPASSWFTPRIGYKSISSEELLHGPEVNGPPVLPFVVIRIKDSGSNPGFIVKDQRGFTYMLKFDVPGHQGIQTTTDFIVSRLFWGFGYNVPEDYQVFFKPDDIKPDIARGITEEEIVNVLNQVPKADDKGFFRSTASQFIEGIILGPTSEEGTRKYDFNDLVDHEDRRTLRALKVFCSFMNHSGIRIDNSIDTFIGSNNLGYVKHYLIDFGEAFGGHAAEHDWMWDGYTHRFSFNHIFKRFFTFGLTIEEWEKICNSDFESVGAFESDIFEAELWNETYQYLPIQNSQDDDNYWAAKTLTALTDNHLRTLVDAANYPEIGAADYVYEVLLERKRKVIKYFFEQVTPLEYVEIKDNCLTLRDMYYSYFNLNNNGVSYFVDIYDSENNRLTETSKVMLNKDSKIKINLNSIKPFPDYIRVNIAKDGGSKRDAQFHLINETHNNYKLVGIVH